jgi:diguanylate cyclase (GGDEF)-like protein
MTLARQMALLIVSVLLLAIGGSLALHQWSARETLRQQLLLRNTDAATMLALSLSQTRGDEVAMRAAVSALFDLGTYERISLTASDGRVIVERRSEPRESAIPAWFQSLALPEEPAATMRVGDGWRDVGSVLVQVRSDWVQAALWRAFVRTAGLLALLGAAAAGLAAWLLRAWQRPLQRTIEQAHAVEEGRFVQVEEPRAPELRRVASSMNSMVQRLSDMFSASAAQLGDLQRRAHLDVITGLSNRRHFMGRLSASLQEPSSSGHGLVMVRVLELSGLNDRYGNDQVDTLLKALADVLATYSSRVPDAISGRLNGSDFCLALPVSGITLETAESLAIALRTAATTALGLPVASSTPVAFVIGGVDGLRGATVHSALAAADAALARAEEGGAFTLVVERAGTPAASSAQADDAAGARTWREQIARALDERRALLEETPVCDVKGQLLHLRCALQIQLDPAGPFQLARRWFGMASRSRLVPRLDLCAVSLALRASARDGLPRCVRLAAASIGASGFVDQLSALLAGSAESAPLLRLEVDERRLASAPDVLTAMSSMLRTHGTLLGIEHAGSALHGDVLARGVVLSHVTLRSHLVQGVALDDAVRDLARGLVAFVHGLGAHIVAEGVAHADDLAALWELGFDAASVPAASTVAAEQAQPMLPV